MKQCSVAWHVTTQQTHQTTMWPVKVQRQFKIAWTAGNDALGNVLHVPYNKLLNTLFPVDTDFVVIPNFQEVSTTKGRTTSWLSKFTWKIALSLCWSSNGRRIFQWGPNAQLPMISCVNAWVTLLVTPCSFSFSISNYLLSILVLYQSCTVPALSAPSSASTPWRRQERSRQSALPPPQITWPTPHRLTFGTTISLNLKERLNCVALFRSLPLSAPNSLNCFIFGGTTSTGAHDVKEVSGVRRDLSWCVADSTFLHFFFDMLTANAIRQFSNL